MWYFTVVTPDTPIYQQRDGHQPHLHTLSPDLQRSNPGPDLPHGGVVIDQESQSLGAIVYSPAQHSLDSLTSPCQLLREHSSYTRNVLPDIFSAETYKRGPLGRPDGERGEERDRDIVSKHELCCEGFLLVKYERKLWIQHYKYPPFSLSNIVGVWLFDCLCVMLTDGQ